MRDKNTRRAAMLAYFCAPALAAAQDASPTGDAQAGWHEVLSVLLVLLVIAVAAFIWFMRQRSKRPPGER
jgi:hypothetical protein